MTSKPYPPVDTPPPPPGVVHRSAYEERGSSAGKIFAVIAILVLAGVAAAWFAGLFTVQTDGALKAPQVSIEGGEVPSVNVDTADIDVGSRTTTVEVPTVEVTPPERSGN